MDRDSLYPAFSVNNVPVVIFAGNHYAPYAGVFIKSLIDYSSPNNNYDIIICERDMSEANKLLVMGLEAGHINVSIRFFNPYYAFNTVGINDIEKFKAAVPYPIEVYCKILLPYILQQYKKLAVIDTDTILKRDIADLFAFDLKGDCLGGVRDITWDGYYRSNRILPSPFNMPAKNFCHNIIGINKPEIINGGLYLMDTLGYRANLPLEKVSQLLHNKASLCADDTLLSSALEGRIKFLPMAWNTYMPVNRHGEAAVKAASEDIQIAHQKAFVNPYLLHWVGRPKPWVCPDVPYGSEWWQVALDTPFIGHILSRMVDALEERRRYYKNRYGKDVSVWDPFPSKE